MVFNRWRSYFLMLSVLFSFNAIAQDSSNTIGKVSIAGPTAASLGKFGDIPVGYHTGTPNINMPVYTAKSGSVSVPIGLSYHAGGLKTTEQASWVGAGWALNAGGVITRTVIGGADDRGYQSYQGYINACTKGHYSDYGFNSFLVAGTDTTLYNTQIALADQAFKNGWYDGEPDMFFFNFGEYSGKFYFNDDRSPVLVPRQDIDIQTDYQLGPGFNGFIVTTPDGIKYYFGRTGNYSSSTDPVELTIPTTAGNGPSFSSAAASSWYLNKIMSADGLDSVTFQYKAEKYSYYSWAMFPVTSNAGLGGTIQQANGVDLVKNITSGVRLSKINFGTGYVTFTPAASPRKDLSNATWSSMTDVSTDSAFALGSITIRDNGNGFCKKDSFYYSYFKCTTTGFNNTFWGSNLDSYNLHSDTSLLRLDSMQEIACDQSIKIPPRKFSYFTETVPRRLTFGVDHWGFYNGADNNTSFIPTYTEKTIQGEIKKKTGANRDASWPAMRAGTLQKIVYPTQGYSLFEYEPHITHVNYYDYIDNLRSSPSVGYDGHNGYLGDGGDNPIQYGFHFSGNSYRIILSNTNNGINGSTAQLTIRDSSNNYVYTKTVNPGQTDTTNIVIAAGNYIVYMHKEYATTGYGASAQMVEEVPVAVNKNAIVGGLRIKTITASDSLTARNIVTKYSYNYANNDSTGNSSGILYSRPVYVQWIRNAAFDYLYGIHLLCDYPTMYKSPATIRPMQTTQGNHIGYNEVYVSQANNGYSVYKYFGSDIWDYNVNDVCVRYVDGATACDPSVPTLPAAPQPFEYKRGELKYDAYYNHNGQILKDAWHYPLYQPDSILTPGHVSAYYPNNISVYTEYNLQSASKIRDSVETTEYNPSTSGYFTTVSASYYRSKYHHMATTRQSLNSKGERVHSELKYAFDYQPPNFTTPDSLRYSQTLAHNDSVSLSAEMAGTSGSMNRSNLYTRYRAKFALDRKKYIDYRRRTFTDPGNIYVTAHNSAKSSAGTELKPVYELQDEYQNPLIEQSNWKDTSLLRASFSRYDFSTNPSGKVYPQKAQLINLTVPSSSFNPSVVSGSTITKDSRYKDESAVYFNSGFPIQSSKVMGAVKSYIWDYYLKQPVAEILNADTSRVAYSSFETDGLGGWFKVTGSSIDASKGITGTKSFSGTLTKKVPRGNYIVTLWANASGTESVNGGAGVLQMTKGIYNLKEWKLTNVDSVWVTGSNIDEVRLFPAGAQMKTYTYLPLVGLASACDVNNRIAYYEYDRLGRLVLIKDQDKNILKKYCYNYFGQLGDCSLYGNRLQTVGFTRNNCGLDSIGSTVIDTVLANTYYASTQAAADSIAISYLNANGQAYANAHGTCTYVPCDGTSCPGPSKKCISGHCEEGGIKYLTSVRNKFSTGWTCTYVYCFHDGTVSAVQTDTNSPVACSPIGICVYW